MSNEALDMAEIISAYQTLFNSQAGQTVLDDLTRRFGYVDLSTMDDQYNVNRMVYNEGQRSVLVAIGQMLSLNPNDPQFQPDKDEADA